MVWMRLLWRSRKEPLYRQRWKERWGRLAIHERSPVVWFHTVSVGEFVAAIPLIHEVRRRFPDRALLITCVTLAGSQRIQQELSAFGTSVYHSYLSFDLPWCWRRWCSSMNLERCIILETELWPNLYRALYQRNIPVAIANARLSESSLRAYQWMGGLMKSMGEQVHRVAAQTPEFANRFIRAGWPSEKIKVLGNLKFDQVVSEKKRDEGQQLRQYLGTDRWVWIAASTHEAEENIIFAVHRRLLKTHPTAVLLLVPRHPDRFTSVYEAVSRHFSTVRRTEGDVPFEAHHSVFLGNTLGELELFYAAADVAFVGGSLAKVGGHNALEAAGLGLPILMGPHTFNCNDVVEILENVGACVRVFDEESLWNALNRWVSHPEERHGAGKAGYDCVQQHKGVVSRQLDWLMREH